MSDRFERVIARRQLDLNRYTEHYAQKLEEAVGQQVAQLEPAWRQMQKRADTRFRELLGEYETETDPLKKKSLKWQVNRSYQFNKQLEQDLQVLDVQQQMAFSDAVYRQFQHSYLINGFVLEQAAKVVATMPVMTPSQVLGILSNPWLPDGATYSDRIRANTAFVASKVRKHVTLATEQGWSINKATRMLDKDIGEGYNNAVRLMRTELCRAASLGASYCYMQNADILDGKRWNATLDRHTAPMCAANDNQIFDLVSNCKN